MTIAIYGKTIYKTFQQAFLKILCQLSTNNIEALIYEPLYEHLTKEHNLDLRTYKTFKHHSEIAQVKYLLTVGGDGTFLDAITIVRDKNIPLIGVNSGHLGFLADISQNNIEQALQAVIQQKHTIEERTMLHLQTNNHIFSDFPYALNDLTIQKKNDPTLIKIHTYIDEYYLCTYWADGLIIATPTGSTAYSLSAGGPIITPQASNFIITPLAPHNLTVRPIIIPDHRTIKLKIEGRANQYLATLDSHYQTITPNTEISIRKAPFTIKTIKLPNNNFYQTLREKLMWGADIRN